jgi:hypothetical protein
VQQRFGHHRRGEQQATKDANAYCVKLGKQMVLQNVNKTGNAAAFGENVSLTFTCE